MNSQGIRFDDREELNIRGQETDVSSKLRSPFDTNIYEMSNRYRSPGSAKERMTHMTHAKSNTHPGKVPVSIESSYAFLAPSVKRALFCAHDSLRSPCPLGRYLSVLKLFVRRSRGSLRHPRIPRCAATNHKPHEATSPGPFLL